MHSYGRSSLIYFIFLVSFGFGKAIIVDQNGQGDYITVQAAIDSVPSGNTQWIFIQINPGTYNEKVIIPRYKDFIYLKGSGIDKTIISSDGHGRTSETPTFSVVSDNFVAEGIKFVNTFDNPVTFDSVNNNFHQAVALKAEGDKLTFRECAFVSIQDTLWDAVGRHYYKSCYIQGLADFIWGFGQSVFEDCSISVSKLPPPSISHGYITAQGRVTGEDPGGFVFIGGSISGEGVALLGRAYRGYSRVIFIGTRMSLAVDPIGWDAWNYKGQEMNFYYTEAKCTGEGANLPQRVNWEKTDVTDEELQQFLLQNFINQDGWIEQQPNN